MSDYSDYKAKVRAEFELFNIHQPDGMPVVGWPEMKSEIKAFLDTCLDNLLVEVEGMVREDMPLSEVMAFTVLNQTFARFKGEGKDGFNGQN